METGFGIVVVLLLCPGLDAFYSPFDLKDSFTEKLFRLLNSIGEDVDTKSYVVEKANPGVDRRLQDNVMRYLRKHTVAKTQRDVADSNNYNNQPLKMIDQDKSFRESRDNNLAAADDNSQNIERGDGLVETTAGERRNVYKMMAKDIVNRDDVDDSADLESRGVYRMMAQDIAERGNVDHNADVERKGVYKMMAQDFAKRDDVDDSADVESRGVYRMMAQDFAKRDDVAKNQPYRMINPYIAKRDDVYRMMAQDFAKRDDVDHNADVESKGVYRMMAQDFVKRDDVDDSADVESGGVYRMMAKDFAKRDDVDDSVDVESRGVYRMMAKDFAKRDDVDDSADLESRGVYRMMAQDFAKRDDVDDSADLESRGVYRMMAQDFAKRDDVDDSADVESRGVYRMMAQDFAKRDDVDDSANLESRGVYRMMAQDFAKRDDVAKNQPYRMINPNIAKRDNVDDSAYLESKGVYRMMTQDFAKRNDVAKNQPYRMINPNIAKRDDVDDSADLESRGVYRMMAKDFAKRNDVAKNQPYLMINPNIAKLDDVRNLPPTENNQPFRMITPVISVREQIDDDLEAVDKHYAERMTNDKLYLVKWLSDVKSLRADVSTDQATSFNQWLQLMYSLDGCCPVVNMSNINQKEALTIMGLSNSFLDVFWPFRYDVNFMNQRLAVSGVKHEYVQEKAQSTKEIFFKMISDRQGIKLPFKANEVLYSFDDDEVIDGLNRTGIITISKAYKEARKHVFSEKEKKAIIPLANEALQLINRTHPELYEAFVQMVSCIGFYKLDKSPYIAGTISSAIGVIWLNPYDIDAWSVPFMAEQIVHEFIHNTLFYAELVHGTYVPNADLSKAQPKSAIRRQYRDYDKSLHAAYVSAGLVTFHTRIGQMRRAAELAKSLPDAVIDLNRVNDETGILDESGNGILKFLNDYMSLTRL